MLRKSKKSSEYLISHVRKIENYKVPNNHLVKPEQ